MPPFESQNGFQASVLQEHLPLPLAQAHQWRVRMPAQRAGCAGEVECFHPVRAVQGLKEIVGGDLCATDREQGVPVRDDQDAHPISPSALSSASARANRQ